MNDKVPKITWNPCGVCGKFHCPNCYNQMEYDLICPMCNTHWVGNEEFKHTIELSDLYE